MSKYLDSDGLLYLWQKIKAKFSPIGHTHTAAQVNAAESGHGHAVATTSAAGFMAAGDKQKLDGIAAGANAYAHPSGDGSRHVPATGTGNGGKFLRAGATASSEAWYALQKSDITALGIPEKDTTYEAATPTSAGLLSIEDKYRLDRAPIVHEFQSQSMVAFGGGVYHTTYSDDANVGDLATTIGTDDVFMYFGSDTSTSGSTAYYWMKLELGAYAHPQDGEDCAGTFGERAQASPGFGGGFRALGLTVNSLGHVTGVTESYVTLPSALATSGAKGLMSAADKAKLDAFGAASVYALKSDITSMYRHKGSVAAVANLPSTGNTAGDVYNLTSTGMNYVWTGSAWDALGTVFSIASVTNAEIDTVVAS